MKSFLWVIPCLVLLASGLFVHRESYGQEIDLPAPDISTAVGTIEFTAFNQPWLYRITAHQVTKLGMPISKITTDGVSNAVVSSVLSPGTQLYGIQRLNHSLAIAVPWKGKYVEAVRIS